MNLPEKIVEDLLDDEDSEQEDPKAFLNRNSDEMLNKFEQIDGDFGDPWLYGGDWYNPFSSTVIHIDGLESEEAGIETDHNAYRREIQLTPEEIAAVTAEFPVDIIPEDPDQKDWNAQDRENAIDDLKDQKRDAEDEAAEAAKTLPVYSFLDDNINDLSAAEQETLARQYDEGAWDTFSDAEKWIEYGKYHGFYELDSQPDRYTKAELSKYLGVEL